MAGPLALIVLDGFGEAPADPSNAISQAAPRFFYSLKDEFPWTTLQCSGEAVGLPCGLMGNSEVGHMNMGAGRIIWQEITRIDKTIADGSFLQNPALVGAVRHAVDHGSSLHLMGLVSDGGVHSSDAHLKALLRLCKEHGLSEDRVQLHAFLDGRDTAPRSAIGYLADVQEAMDAEGVGRIATVVGRYYAMDRDQRWERTKKAYDALVGLGVDYTVAPTATAAVEASYADDKGDEFVLPVAIGEAQRGRIEPGDAAIFFNYRTDRTRQLTAALTLPDFDGFDRGAFPDLHMVTMTRYREDFDCPVAFGPQYLKGIFPEVVSKAGLSQLRIAETEKYAHVTFFMSGGTEAEFPGERRILVPSPKVATYDLQPAMSAPEVAGRLVDVLDTDAPDVTILNFANADMVGHTGILPAAVSAVSALDECLARVVPKFLELGGTVAITADHGNCEMMVDPDTGKPHTAHTINPVPFLLAGNDLRGRSLKSGGRLCDIATTLLPLLGLDPDPAMDGVNLL